MKRLVSIISLLSLAFTFVACQDSDVKRYSIEDSAMNFGYVSVNGVPVPSNTHSFSLKGMKADKDTLTVPLILVGPIADYDRPVTVKVYDKESDNAVEGEDFRLFDVVLKAGEYHTDLLIEVNKLKKEKNEIFLTVEIIPNEWFRAGYPDYQKATIVWSEKYVRPVEKVFREWYYFFCKGYSEREHELLVEFFGTDIELYTRYNDPSLINRNINFFYAANHDFRDWVKAHDDANPGNPYMHSDDFETYPRYTTPRGEGDKPARIPTIYESLEIL